MKAFLSPAGGSGARSASTPVIDVEANLEASSGGDVNLSEAVQWMEANLEDDEQETRKYEQRALYKRTGGRQKNAQLGLENRGVAGGWGSNRLYSGMERRREDWTAAEGVDICRSVKELRAGGSDASEVNRALLSTFGRNTGAGGKGRWWRSMQGVWEKRERTSGWLG